MDKGQLLTGEAPQRDAPPGRLSRWPGLGPPRAAWKSSSFCSPICPPTPAWPSCSFSISPTAPQHVAEILARATAMPVSEAADGMPVEANHVYVIRPTPI